jgi:hypothetical protein
MAADARRTVLLRRARLALAVFTVGLVLSGLTAIPVRWELEMLAGWLGAGPDDAAADHAGLAAFVVRARNAVRDAFDRWPLLAYGTDWLAFAHVVLGVLFVGAVIDPVRNRWVITFGLIACALVIPWAFVFGHVRGIPVAWRLIDCAFGVVGAIPLALARRAVIEWERRTG